MTRVLLLPVLISFAVSAAACPALIPLLRKLKFGQQVREEGNPEHLKKQGTPTMGGLAFIPAFLITCLIFVFRYPKLLPVMLLTLGFALVGFTDDYIKVVKKKSEGFKPWQKLVCQIVMTGLFAWYLQKNVGTSVILPFTGGKEWDMGWLYIPFVFLCVLGTDNGTNFTDGLDGLLSSVTVVAAFFFLIIAGEGEEHIMIASGAMAGVLLGFLFSNAHPAKMFMGDTGSLAIGGFVSAAALMTKTGWFILIIGMIYLIEVISVILQVSYFKLTHGKRIFKMAPIHHHFELCGYSETQIVTMFTAVTILLCIIGYMAL